MPEYFYLDQYVFDAAHIYLIRVSGYYTDARHTMFFPSSGYSREEVIAMIRAGTVVFLYDGCYHQVYVKLVKTEIGEFLRVDHQKHASDYLG